MIIIIIINNNKTKHEIENTDHKTIKIMTAYEALHPKADIDRLYVHRKDGEKNLMSIKNTIEYDSSMVEH